MGFIPGLAQWVKESGFTAAAAQIAAAAWTKSLAQGLLYAVGVAIKKKEKKKKEKRKLEVSRCSFNHSIPDPGIFYWIEYMKKRCLEMHT